MQVLKWLRILFSQINRGLKNAQILLIVILSEAKNLVISVG